MQASASEHENYIDHGIMAPVGMTTWYPSVIATVNADGKRVIFIKLWTGWKASYLFIDAETGKTEQIFPKSDGWGAYGVQFTPENVVYDTMGSQLVAINVSTRSMRNIGGFDADSMALSYARAKDGTIYAGIYPSATIVSYHPKTKCYINHGPLNDESWPQYLRPLQIDSSGWIYGSIGMKEGQVIGFHPETGARLTFIPEGRRRRGQPELYQGEDGHIYASADGWGLHRLSDGKAIPVDRASKPVVDPDSMAFPDGSRITKTNIPDRKLYIQDAGSQEVREVHFDYTSTGVPIYTLIAGPAGRIIGATGIPMRVWKFDPATGKAWNSGLGGYGGHINQFVRQGKKLYGAVYSKGELLEYDPLEPFDDTRIDLSANPRRVHYSEKAMDLYGRPNAVLAHPDGVHVLVGGKAARVLPGSGLLIYDTKSEECTQLDRSDLIPDQGINAMVALPDGDVLVGTSVHPPTAGTPGFATNALLYRFHLPDHTIKERWSLKPGSPAVLDMVVAADGLVYGLAEPSRLFVFDPSKGTFLHEKDLAVYGKAAGSQAPRCMIIGPDGAIYALFQKAVVRIELETLKHCAISQPPAEITAGIAIQDHRLYFSCGANLFSCSLKQGMDGATE